MNKYKIGDRVKIREDLEENKKYGAHYFVDTMGKMRGLTLTIDEVYDDGTYRVKEIGYNWTEEMIEGLAEETINKKMLEFVFKKYGITKEELEREMNKDKELEKTIQDIADSYNDFRDYCINCSRICDRRSCKIAKISEDYDLRGTRKPSCGTIWHVLHERGLWDFIDLDCD